MTLRATLALGTLCLGAALALGVTTSHGEPTPGGTVTVYTASETVTVAGRVGGHSASYWRRQDAKHRRAAGRLRRANGAQRRIVAWLRIEERRQARDYADDYGIRSSGFLCIHRYEGSWTDPGAPYYGGLQMDGNFMATYGGPFLRAYGTADHWPPYLQIRRDR